MEHLLVQHLTAYFNVGDHGHIRLEDADWNDGLDMASERGESVAFTSVYAGNLMQLSRLLQEVKKRRLTADVEIAEELELLLESKAESGSYPEKNANVWTRIVAGPRKGSPAASARAPSRVSR